MQFSPTDQYQFVAAFENGTIQRWDIRQPQKFEQRINAHSGPIFALEWHHEGRYVATGSRDKTIRVRFSVFVGVKMSNLRCFYTLLGHISSI